MYYTKLQSKWGMLTASINNNAELVGLWFDGQKYFPEIEADAVWINKHINTEQLEEQGRTRLKGEINEKVLKVLKHLRDQLAQYEKGELQCFDLPLKPQGSLFRHEVWRQLLKIPYGETTTYGEIGEAVAKDMCKSSMAGQAIGGAVGHNPISIIIPCHRVVGKDGSLTGYAGGLDKKQALLEHEQRASVK